jgi:Uma2 family endonuclease
MQTAPVTWFIDPDDPRAPPQELWDRMTHEERSRIVDALPSEFEITEANPPEGDFHFNPKVSAKQTLDGYFQRIGRRVYLACELPVYYPGEAMFAPDVMAVLDVELRERASWVVAHEGKGLDFALEIVWSGRAKKDLEDNVARYAARGIAEYFIFDRKRRRLRGFRLPAGAQRYVPIVPQQGLLASTVLGLELGLEGDKLRFFDGFAPLQETSELLSRLGSMVGDLEARIEESERQIEEEKQRAEEEKQRAEEEKQRAEEEKQRAEEAERKLAEALAKIERLERERR